MTDSGGTGAHTPRVLIHYRRLPDRERVFDQRVVLERPDVIVTLSEPLDLAEPLVHEGRIMLEAGSLALWFTFPGAWHDIGLFHDREGRYTGTYANVLTPVEIEGARWETTDLFLDLWWPEAGAPEILDRDELDEALERAHVDARTAERAVAEAERLLAAARAGAWPPDVVAEWSLQRALEALDA